MRNVSIAIVGIVLSILSAIYSLAFARIWFVNAQGTGDAPNMQAAIDSCVDGDWVVAISGVYTGYGNYNIDFRGKRITLMSEKSYNPSISDSTVIDCMRLGRGFYFHTNEDSLSVLDGFVIANACEDPLAIGGGILCENASPTIRNNSIRNCLAGDGAGIAAINSHLRIIGNQIYLCLAIGDGVAIWCSNSSPYIAGNSIRYNDSNGEHSVYLFNCDSIVVEDNFIYSNWGRCDYNDIASLEGIGFELGSNRLRANELKSVSMPFFVSPAGLGTYNSSGIVRGNRIIQNSGELFAFNSTLKVIDNEFNDGGGVSCPPVYCNNSQVEIVDNSISGRGLLSDGLAIHMMNSLPSKIIGNAIGPCFGDLCQKAAIYYSGCSESSILDNLIFGSDGAAIICLASIRIEGNVIYSNRSFEVGSFGAIYCEASPLIEGNTIVGNLGFFSGGIYCGPNSSPIIKSNIIANNIAISEEYEILGGGGIYADSTASPIVVCCDLFSNEPVNYIGIPDQTGINGNISLDPLFCGAEHHDYTIHYLSPCAAGNNPNGPQWGQIGALGVGCDFIETLLRNRSVAVDCEVVVITWEIAQVRNDLEFAVMRSKAPFAEYIELEDTEIVRSGAFYSFRDYSCEIGASYKYRVDVIDGTGRRNLFETEAISVPSMPMILFPNYPNPFNPATTISYYLPFRSHVRLQIYDIAGRHVATLIDEEQERGKHFAVWQGLDDDGGEAASGIYFCRLTSGRESSSRKIVLLR